MSYLCYGIACVHHDCERYQRLEGYSPPEGQEGDPVQLTCVDMKTGAYPGYRPLPLVRSDAPQLLRSGVCPRSLSGAQVP